MLHLRSIPPSLRSQQPHFIAFREKEEDLRPALGPFAESSHGVKPRDAIGAGDDLEGPVEGREVTVDAPVLEMVGTVVPCCTMLRLWYGSRSRKGNSCGVRSVSVQRHK